MPCTTAARLARTTLALAASAAMAGCVTPASKHGDSATSAAAPTPTATSVAAADTTWHTLVDGKSTDAWRG